MFTLGLAGGLIGCLAVAAKEEGKYIASLSQQERDEYLAKKQKEYEEYKAHKLALEIAEASRPRNFWGK